MRDLTEELGKKAHPLNKYLFVNWGEKLSVRKAESGDYVSKQKAS